MILPFPFVLALTISQDDQLMLPLRSPASGCPSSSLQLSATDVLSSRGNAEVVASKRCAAPPVLTLPPASKQSSGGDSAQLELAGIFATGQASADGSAPNRGRSYELYPNSPQLHTSDVRLPGEGELFMRVLGEKMQTPLLVGEGAFMTTYILYNLLHPTTTQPPPSSGNAHQKR